MGDRNRRFRCQAVIFDLDGTLVDSEGRTDEVISSLLEAEGLELSQAGELGRFHGATWQTIAAELTALIPALSKRPLSDELQRLFQADLVRNPPPEIPGARATLTAAAQHHPTAIVTSSNRESLDLALVHLGVVDLRLTTVCSEDVRRSKPAPEGYLLAAQKLGVLPSLCLVFEDSERGLAAARAAGMPAIAIAHRCRASHRRLLTSRALMVISDYTELPAGFFREPGPETV